MERDARSSVGRSRRGIRSAVALVAALSALVVVVAAPAGATAPQPSGQRAWGRSSVEPAINDADGSLMFINTPMGAPFPSKVAEAATAPLYLPVYPPSAAAVETGGVTLNCHPDNCDHANILPAGLVNGLGLTAVYPLEPGTSATCAHFDPSNGNVDGTSPLPCAPLLGHDHLIGVPPHGDWNIGWDVHLVVFTSVPDHAVRTLDELNTMIRDGDAIDVGEIVTFNCARVSSVVYNKATPLSF